MEDSTGTAPDAANEASQAAQKGREIMEGLHERREKHLQRSRGYRIGFAIAGFAVVAAGIAMLVFPGPGWLAIIAGLGMLALEFAWAERLLQRVITFLVWMIDRVARATRTEKIVLGVVVVIALAAAGWAIITWELWELMPGL